MNTEKLMKSLRNYGIDEKGVIERFCNNLDLYAICFSEFLRETTFPNLEKAIAEGDYKTAFESAHSLKGVTGNLGLTDLYHAYCVLVEDLRSNRFDKAKESFALAAALQRSLFDLVRQID